MRPIVGITTDIQLAAFGAWEEESALVPTDYVRAVERAGGRALLVPPSDDGIEEELDAPPMFEGNAYADESLERVPSTLREAIDALEGSKLARSALGDEVVDHYLNYARTEQRLFDQTVTCYERERLFERV